MHTLPRRTEIAIIEAPHRAYSRSMMRPTPLYWAPQKNRTLLTPARTARIAFILVSKTLAFERPARFDTSLYWTLLGPLKSTVLPSPHFVHSGPPTVREPSLPSFAAEAVPSTELGAVFFR